MGDLGGKTLHFWVPFWILAQGFIIPYYFDFWPVPKISDPPCLGTGPFPRPPCPLGPKIVKFKRISKYSHVIYQSIGNSKQITNKAMKRAKIPYIPGFGPGFFRFRGPGTQNMAKNRNFQHIVMLYTNRSEIRSSLRIMQGKWSNDNIFPDLGQFSPF